MNKNLFLNKAFITLVILLSILKLSAQELLIECGNPFLQEYTSKHQKEDIFRHSLDNTPLALPFFDDFSASFVFPDQKKWLDRQAFISNGSSTDPISYCAARLDAINEYGDVYSHLSSNGSNPADSLTSRPIDLNLNISDSVYFSFFYQTSGIGNSVPSKKDSLILQFKDPDADWKTIWKKEGGNAMNRFQNVLIPITQEEYLKTGFQFRFINHASVSSGYEPSWISNTDFWLIDFIHLDKDRSYKDTIAKDVAFISNFSSAFKEYESVPWEHYKENPNDVEKFNSFKYIYKNTWEETQNINRQIEISCIYGNGPLLSLLDDSENIEAYETLSYDKSINYNFVTDHSDSAKFLIKGFLKTDATDERKIFRSNDTIRYYQYFNNYYCYDDGTPEKGYGIMGKGGSLAYKFRPIVSDTLRGVNIFFNKTQNGGNRKFFLLTVWEDNNGVPGNILHQEDGYLPNFSDSIIGFTYYSLKTPIFIDKPFYVGWVKTSEDMLNCGYDINRDASHNLFINLGGAWQQSQFKGALMLRPVFSKKEITNIDFTYQDNKKIEIFPNPANDFIQISNSQDISRIDIYELSGKLVLSDTNNSRINVSSLKPGVYILKPISQTETHSSIKLMISK